MTEEVRVIPTFGRIWASFVSLGLLTAFLFSVGVVQNPEATRRFSHETVVALSWIWVIVFGGGLLLSAAQIIRPSKLVLTTQGFRLLWLRPMPLIRWSDVEVFDLIRTGPLNNVCFRLTPEAVRSFGSQWWIMAAPMGFHGCIFSGFTNRPARVIEELRSWKARHGELERV